MVSRIVAVVALIAFMTVGLVGGGVDAAPAAQQSDPGRVVELLPTATITANGAGSAVPGFGVADILRMTAVCGAVGGTSPSFTFSLQDTLDGVNFNTLASATALTANGVAVLNFAEVRAATAQQFADALRVSFTVSGTTPTASCRVLVYAE